MCPHIEFMLPAFQHGFRERHSINTAVREKSNYFYEVLDNDEIAYVVYFDIIKAYDSLNAYLLLKIIDLLNLSKKHSNCCQSGSLTYKSQLTQTTNALANILFFSDYHKRVFSPPVLAMF